MPKDFNDDTLNENAQRVQQNVRNLPITSIALAGVLGAGAVALLSGAFLRRK
jgi:hypothetical protein